MSYANVPYPKQMLAALANIDVDYPGSCGRCYEVTGLLQAVSLNLKGSHSAEGLVPWPASGLERVMRQVSVLSMNVEGTASSYELQMVHRIRGGKGGAQAVKAM